MRITGKIRDIGTNAVLSVLLQPLWAVPFFLYNTYATLYMIKLGVREGEIGVVNSVSFLVKAAVSLFAGYIINKLGRKKSLLIFDMVSWVIPYIILSFATSYEHFLIAGIINATSVVNTIAWQCCLVEDVRQEHRVYVFNVLEVMMILSGVFTPITGWLIGKHTLIPVIRGMYFFAFLCMAVSIIVRAFMLKETSVGMNVREYGGAKLPEIYQSFWKAFAYIIHNRMLIILFIINILIMFNLVINNIYYVPYLTMHLGLSEITVSFYPFVTSIAAIIMLVLVLSRFKLSQFIFSGVLLLYIAGTCFLLLVPAETSGQSIIRSALLFSNVICWAVAKSLVNIILQTKISNVISDSLRDSFQPFSQIHLPIYFDCLFSLFSSVCFLRQDGKYC